MKKMMIGMLIIMLLLPSITYVVDANELPDGNIIGWEEAVQGLMMAENLNQEEAKRRMRAAEEAVLEAYAEAVYEEDTEKYAHLDLAKALDEIKKDLDVRQIIHYICVRESFVDRRIPIFKAEMEAVLRIVQDSQGTHRIDQVLYVMSKPVRGIGPYAWIKLASGSDISFTEGSVYLWTTGYFELELPAEVSESTSTSITGHPRRYYRTDTVKGTKTYFVK